MANIRKRGSKWQVQVRRAGQPHITKTFNKKSDAHVWARDMDAKGDRGEILFVGMMHKPYTSCKLWATTPEGLQQP